MPVRCESMSRSVTLLLSSSVLNSMAGTDFLTGSSQVNSPSCTSMPAATAVKSLLLDAIGISVSAVKGSFFP